MLEEAKKEAHRKLVLNAIQSIYYVANGNVMKRELSQKFGITEDEAEWILANKCNELVEKINKI